MSERADEKTPERQGDRQVASRARSSKGILSGWPMVAVFMFLYFLSFVDRAIITLMVEPIEHDLELSDIQMSLLLGPAFGLFYAIAGLPMGWLLDRYSRRWITAAMVFAWGAATTVSGFANSF
jgi:MFS family permease